MQGFISKSGRFHRFTCAGDGEPLDPGAFLFICLWIPPIPLSLHPGGQVTMAGSTGSTSPSLAVAVPTPISGPTLPIMILLNSIPYPVSQHLAATLSTSSLPATLRLCSGIFIGWPCMAWTVLFCSGSRVSARLRRGIMASAI